ncbi:MAG: acyl-CoA thioesterase [Blastocatellia bacterium]
MRVVACGLLLFTLSAFAACKGELSKEAASAPSATSSPAKPVKSVAKIVAFGDSLTAGYGLSPEESYPSLLQKKLAADGFDYEIVNAGISGDTSASGVRRIDWSLESGDVKIVILELGANDILRGQPIAEMKKNLSTIIERAKAHGARVLLAGMEAPTNSGIDYRRWTHGAFSELAKEQNVTLIPFLLDRVAGIQSLNQEDGIHPNPEGARIMADTVYQYLKPMLEKNDQAATK